MVFGHIIQLLFMLENQMDTYKEDNVQDTYRDGEEDPLQRVDEGEDGPDEEDDEEYQEEEDDDYEPTVIGEQHHKLIDESCAGVSFLKTLFQLLGKRCKPQSCNVIKAPAYVFFCEFLRTHIIQNTYAQLLVKT